jgi:hypothetical protein
MTPAPWTSFRFLELPYGNSTNYLNTGSVEGLMLAMLAVDFRSPLRGRKGNAARGDVPRYFSNFLPDLPEAPLMLPARIEAIR